MIIGCILLWLSGFCFGLVVAVELEKREKSARW